MKLQPDRIDGVNAISSLQAGSVSVNGMVYEHSILVPWKGQVQVWRPQRFEDLQTEDFVAIAALRPELVIFGSGSRLRFPAPALLRPLIEQRIGTETMDLGAACRTYNVLASESRSVVLALLREAV